MVTTSLEGGDPSSQRISLSRPQVLPTTGEPNMVSVRNMRSHYKQLLFIVYCFLLIASK